MLPFTMMPGPSTFSSVMISPEIPYQIHFLTELGYCRKFYLLDLLFFYFAILYTR